MEVEAVAGAAADQMAHATQPANHQEERGLEELRRNFTNSPMLC